MTSSPFKFSLVIPRRVRGALALFVLTMYLFGGVVHELFDLDVASMSSKTVISLSEKDAGHSDKGVIADHHCHGCFSVSISAPSIAASEVMPSTTVLQVSVDGHRGLTPGLDPPPPKFLT